MNEYNELIYVRNETVSDVGPWHWISSDSGAWIGPKDDWQDSHSKFILEHVTDWSVCVQAGGNQGMYPRLLSSMFSHVYTFEPDPLNFHCLVNNCQVDNIYKLQAALGAETGLVRLNRHTMHNTGCHTVSSDGECHVPMITIDSLKLQSCGLFQLDIERYEIHALKGALETIERCKPVIQCENGNHEILDLIKPFGYEAVSHSLSDTFYKVI
jgi:FkbM family methyltransferase